MPKHKDPSLNRLRSKAEHDRHLAKIHKKKASLYKRRTAFIQAAIARRVHRRHHLNHTVVLDGTPTFLGLKLVLLDCRASGGWDGVLVSSDRREEIEPLLHKLGKQSQAELVRGYEQGLPGYFPANPYNQTTHALYSDGVAYSKIPPQHRLPHWWMLGMDVSLWDSLLAAAKKLGYDLRQPYPTSSEAHHLNAYEDPKRRLVQRGRI